MVKSKGYQDKDGETKTLRDCVEMYALMICEDIENGEGIERTLIMFRRRNSMKLLTM